jgi:hypothetical protein
MHPASRPGPGRAFLIGALGAVATRLASSALASRPPGGAARWTRTNHAGAPVSLLEGPAYVAGVTVASAPAGPAAVVAALGGGAVGVVDDLATDATDKGFRGHLSALRRGRVTTGSLKIVGMALTGVVAVALAERGGERRDAPVSSLLVDTLVGGALVAGSANLVNLFDLRPGRALKVVVATGLPLALGGRRSLAAAAAAGAALGALPEDLRGRSMLGDAGANAAGAVLGTALAGSLGRRGRVAVLLGIAGLTAASEKVSFTRVIESTPVLREVDAWGRPT